MSSSATSSTTNKNSTTNSTTATMLHEAVLSGSIDRVRQIMNENAKLLAIQNGEGKSSLYLAVKEQSVAIVKMLLESNDVASFVNLTDGHGRTALHVALEESSKSSSSSLEISRLLIGVASLDVNVHDAFGTTPLHLAVKLLNDELVLLLVSRQANVNATTVSGQTPLHWLVNEQNAAGGQNSNKFDDIVRILLSSSTPVADVTLADKNGTTPLTIVKTPSTKAVLEEHHAKQRASAAADSTTTTAAVRLQAQPAVKKAKTKIIKIDLK